MSQSATGSSVDPRDAFVLVVEYNLQEFQKIARGLVSLRVWNYEWKTSGWHVLVAAEKKPRVDLILLDINVSDKTSEGILRALRTAQSLKQTRIVALGADASPGTMEEALRLGFDGFYW